MSTVPALEPFVMDGPPSTHAAHWKEWVDRLKKYFAALALDNDHAGPCCCTWVYQSDGWESRVPEDLDPVRPERDKRLEEGVATNEQPENDMLSATPEGGMTRTEDQSLSAGQAATAGESKGDDPTVTEEDVT
ncbi:hypothetical protein NDU88_003604 [Pleurodeles waltl]|uniref:Uncharacterized protein n=1 Tax=Pleurodeles waltl TaxID=8319 RepID=A0AAV7M999_PLEWA|nr:hypothetical protein NDU88_003604 [Pleurodeles waltl]